MILASQFENLSTPAPSCSPSALRPFALLSIWLTGNT